MLSVIQPHIKNTQRVVTTVTLSIHNFPSRTQRQFTVAVNLSLVKRSPYLIREVNREPFLVYHDDPGGGHRLLWSIVSLCGMRYYLLCSTVKKKKRVIKFDPAGLLEKQKTKHKTSTVVAANVLTRHRGARFTPLHACRWCSHIVELTRTWTDPLISCAHERNWNKCNAALAEEHPFGVIHQD